MEIHLGFEIAVERKTAAPLLLALQLRPEEERRIKSQTALILSNGAGKMGFLDTFGNHRLRIQEGQGPLQMSWHATVQDDGLPDAFDPGAVLEGVDNIPGEVLQFLLPSRYCESDLLMDEAWKRFGRRPRDWSLVQAILDFVHGHIEFGYHHARSDKTAIDALKEGRGVCRDFAHLTIAFCRALNIPARYVSGYLGDIGVPYAGPGDFCAWVEVFAGGTWRTVDARYNVPRIGRVKMVHGRDAVDVPMITSFGKIEITNFSVTCDEIPNKAA